MLKYIVITLMIVFVSVYQLSAQLFIGNDYKEVDSITYANYINQDWQEVINNGNVALHKNIDYYYLRMRMGIASYYLGWYSDAADHFEKALRFNSNEQTAQLYLYDTYLLLGKNTKAYRLSKNFTKKTAALIPVKRKFVEAVYAGGGTTLSNNYAKNDNYFVNNDNDTLHGSRVLIGNKSDVYAGISLNLSPVISLYAGYNRLQIQKRINFQYTQALPVLDSVQREDWGFQNFFSQDTTFFQKSFNETILQDEIYLNTRFQFETGWALSFFSNVVMVNSVNIKIDTVLTSITDTSYYVYGNAPEYVTFNYDEYDFMRSDSAFTNFVVGLSLEKDYNNVTLNLYGSLSSLNGLRQNQLGLSGFYYLNPNSTVYGVTDLTWFSQRWIRGWNENRLILNQKIGSKLYRNLWGEAVMTLGNLNNANTNNGFIVYNQADKMIFIGGLTFRLYLGKHFELDLLYRYTAYEGSFIEDSNSDQNTGFTSNIFNYQTQSIFGGLKWRF